MVKILLFSPPVAVAAFAASSIAGAGAMGTAMTSVRVVWPAFLVPFLFVYSPSLLMQGKGATILLVTCTAMLGIWLISIGIVGYFRARIGLAERLLVIVAGLCVLIPPDIGHYGWWIEGAGAALSVFWLAREFAVPRGADRATTHRS